MNIQYDKSFLESLEEIADKNQNHSKLRGAGLRPPTTIPVGQAIAARLYSPEPVSTPFFEGFAAWWLVGKGNSER